MIELLKICFKWKIPIIIVGILAALGSSVISLMLPEYYESKIVFYPSNPSLVDRQYLFGEQSGEQLVSYFGAGDDLDRVMTIAKSAGLKNYLIEKFGLMEHYGIKADDEYPMTKVNQEFKDNYKAIKNEYDAVEITVLDTSQVLAAAIANEAAAHIDRMSKQMTRKNKEKIVEVFNQKLKSKQAELKALTDSMASIRQSNPKDQQLRIFEIRQESVAEELNNIAKLHEQYSASMGLDIPSLYIVEKAYPAEKRKFPVRWLIVVSSTLGALFVILLFVVLMEKYKEIRPQLANG